MSFINPNVAQASGLGVASTEVRFLQQAITEEGMSLNVAEKFVQYKADNYDFNIADWLDGKGQWRYPAEGDPYLGMNIDRMIRETQQQHSERLWLTGDKEAANQIRELSSEDYLRENFHTQQGFYDEDPFNRQLVQDFELADERYRFEPDAPKTQMEEEMRMKDDIRKDMQSQLDTLSKPTDDAFQIGDDFLDDSIVVERQRVWNEVDTELARLLEERTAVYKEIEDAMPGVINQEEELLDNEAFINANRVTQLDMLSSDLTRHKGVLEDVREGNYDNIVDEFDQLFEGLEKVEDMDLEALDQLIESISSKPMPAARQPAVNEFIDRASDRAWSTAQTDAALRGSGADGLMNDAYNSYGLELGDLSSGVLGTNMESLLRAAGEAEGKMEFKAPEEEFAGVGDVAPYEVGPELGDAPVGAWERVELGVDAPLLQAERFIPNAEQEAMGAEMMDALMMDVLGMVPLGLGGKLPYPEPGTGYEYGDATYSERDRLYGDFMNARGERYLDAQNTWLGAETYVNIANRWYKAKVKDMYFASPSSPTTKFEVEVEWDDLDGKTMDYVVPASSDRIRLQSDGPPPLREGGITRYEPFTDPQEGFARRHLNDLLPLEQVLVDGTWREVKSVDGQVIKFSDGTTYDSPYNSLQWRARGRIHTADNPKQPKWDPKKEWHDIMKTPGADNITGIIDHFQTIPKSGPKGSVLRNWIRHHDNVTPAVDPTDELTDQEYYDKYYADLFGSMHAIIEEGGEEEEEEEEEEDESVIPDGTEVTPDISDPIPDISDPIPDIPDEPKPVTNQSGHRQDDPFPVDTQEGMEHTVETGGFHALEKALGMDMPQIYENYALGNFAWQTSTTIPEWLSPNLSKLHGGNEQYNYLLDKYSDDYKMMQNLERVDTAMRAPYVLNYLDTTHNELRSTYHNGLNHDQIHNITNSNMPGFAYNSQGHIVLRDDKTIDHSFNHNREVVHTFDTTGQVASEHTQLDFAKEAQELSGN